MHYFFPEPLRMEGGGGREGAKEKGKKDIYKRGEPIY